MDWQEICFKFGAPGNEAGRAEACRLMAAKLAPATPAIARIWLLQQLERIGRGECVEALAVALTDSDAQVRECARRALAANPAPEAVAKLRAALAGAKDSNFKIGLINALGDRGDKESINAFIHGVQSNDVAVAVAAVRALGKVGGFENTMELPHESPTPAVLRAAGDLAVRWAEKVTRRRR